MSFGSPQKLCMPLFAAVGPATFPPSWSAVRPQWSMSTHHSLHPPNHLQLVWSALPAGGSAAHPVTASAYTIQRWPSADMPMPGQNGYQSSLQQLQVNADAGTGTFTATDDSGGGSGGTHYYRVLALASTGRLLAATAPASAVSERGKQSAACALVHAEQLLTSINLSSVPPLYRLCIRVFPASGPAHWAPQAAGAAAAAASCHRRRSPRSHRECSAW